MKGKVRWFNAAKGYGFIGREDGSDVFVHCCHSAGVRSVQRTRPEANNRVFEVGSDGLYRKGSRFKERRAA